MDDHTLGLDDAGRATLHEISTRYQRSVTRQWTIDKPDGSSNFLLPKKLKPWDL
jgi:hypothetical protein